MEQSDQMICPTCDGKKTLAGSCECSSEWRGTQGENEWESCQCTPEIKCPSCNGTGIAEPAK